MHADFMYVKIKFKNLIDCLFTGERAEWISAANQSFLKSKLVDLKLLNPSYDYIKVPFQSG